MMRKSGLFDVSLVLGCACAIAATVAGEASARAQSTVTFGGSASASDGVQASGSSSGANGANGASGPSASGAGDASDAEDEWAVRDRQLAEASSLSGSTGLLHMPHAQGGAAGQFRLNFTTEYFSAGFLCSDTFPCRSPNGGGAVTSDTLSHIGGTLTLSVGITKWLEAYAGTSAYANSDDQNKPTLLQVLGDTDFGVKAFFPLSKVFYVGGFAELWLINGTGSVGLDGSGTSFKLGPVITADLRGMQKKLPLRFTFLTDYMFDNTADVLTDTENARKQSVTRIERFGLNVNRVDHFDMALGGEAFLADDRVRPFIEYNILIPTNRQNYLCKPNNPSRDQCLANDAIAPSKLTFGSRFYPWKKGFSLLAALDVGVTGVGEFIEEVSPTPPWTLFIGGGWAIDTRERPERTKMVEKIIEKDAAHGRFKGLVHEKDKTDGGVPGAIVVWANHPEITSLATGADGRFTTQELPAGQYAFTIRADGYREGACSGTLGAESQDVQVDCAIEALPRVGAIVGHVRDGDSGSPVSGAIVKVTDGAKHDLTYTADATGGFHGEGVAPGAASFSVSAEGYMTAVLPFDVKSRQDNAVDIVLRKRPKNPLVSVGRSEITVKQQIQFAVDSANILPESQGLMTEIADAILRNPRIKRVEIQGHTDNTGPAEHNQSLSEQRAEAVRAWLTGHGVGPDRLVAKGYGQSKPLVPNVTSANKARNRRVQFIILDQDAAAPAGNLVIGKPAP